MEAEKKVCKIFRTIKPKTRPGVFFFFFAFFLSTDRARCEEEQASTTEHFAISEPSIEVSELHKMGRSAGFEALKQCSVWSGLSSRNLLLLPRSKLKGLYGQKLLAWSRQVDSSKSGPVEAVCLKYARAVYVECVMRLSTRVLSMKY